MDEKQELLEIYKLHAELFDQLGQQRSTTNRLYLVIMSILFGIFIGFLQFADGLSMVVLMISFGWRIGCVTGSRLVHANPRLRPAQFRET